MKIHIFNITLLTMAFAIGTLLTFNSEIQLYLKIAISVTLLLFLVTLYFKVEEFKK